jgi:hypothetical protein
MFEFIDLAAPLGILLAMILSYEPKRSVIAFCWIIGMIMIGIDYMCYKGILESWTFFYSAWGMEFAAFIGLLLVARQVKTQTDRFFTRLMGVFFFISSSVTLLRIFKATTHPEYILLAELVAALHVLSMLGFSDGFRIVLTRIYDLFNDNGGDIPDLRG